MLPAIPWLLLVEALVGLASHPRARLVRLVNSAVLLAELPGRVSDPVGLGLAILLAASWRLASRSYCLTFPALLLTALVLAPPGGWLVVLLVGLWAIWLTVALLRDENLAEHLGLVTFSFCMVTLTPVLVAIWAVDAFVRYEGRGKPRTRVRWWPARNDELPPRPPLTPWVALLLPLVLKPPGGFGVALLLTVLAASFPMCASAARVARVTLVLGWFLHGYADDLTCVVQWGTLLMALAALGVVPLVLAVQIRLSVRTQHHEVYLLLERNHLLLETLGWTLAVCLVGGAAALSLALTVLAAGCAFRASATPGWP